MDEDSVVVAMGTVGTGLTYPFTLAELLQVAEEMEPEEDDD